MCVVSFGYNTTIPYIRLLVKYVYPVYTLFMGKNFLHFLIPDDLLERIESFRFKHKFMSRSAAIIWLIEWALKQKPDVGKR